jgi:hypothetical protein
MKVEKGKVLVLLVLGLSLPKAHDGTTEGTIFFHQCRISLVSKEKIAKCLRGRPGAG